MHNRQKRRPNPLPDQLYAPPPPIHMVAATVTKYDDRRGSGQAVIKSSGKKVRIPLSALEDAKVVALSVGDEIYVTIDRLDRGRVEALRLPDS
jgi:hypothetical protein